MALLPTREGLAIRNASRSVLPQPTLEAGYFPLTFCTDVLRNSDVYLVAWFWRRETNNPGVKPNTAAITIPKRSCWRLKIFFSDGTSGVNSRTPLGSGVAVATGVGLGVGAGVAMGVEIG